MLKFHFFFYKIVVDFFQLETFKPHMPAWKSMIKLQWVKIEILLPRMIISSNSQFEIFLTNFKLMTDHKRLQTYLYKKL